MSDRYLGAQTSRARTLYRVSPYRVPLELIRAGLRVKRACVRANATGGYLTGDEARAVEEAIDYFEGLPEAELGSYFDLDAYQGGAGTATNMSLNEAIAARAREASPRPGAAGPDRAAGPEGATGDPRPDGATEGAAAAAIDPLDHVNLHQSTNDVMPTALRLMLLNMFEPAEREIEALQTAIQEGETAHADVLKTARTQLRDATVITAGRQFATWAGTLGRDRWRLFKARERLKEVNLGGTAVGTGLGAPRDYVLGVIRELQRVTRHPVTRADDPVEATSNYDQLLEAMEAVNIAAAGLQRIASDIRLLASGPGGGIGEIVLPAPVKGSSIMPGKVNPVQAEAVVQASERIAANHGLLSRMCARGELELNAFLPAIAHGAWESLRLLTGAAHTLRDLVASLEVDAARCEKNLEASHARVVALLPLFGYAACERIVAAARERGMSLSGYLVSELGMAQADCEELLSTRNLTRLGYDPTRYGELRRRYATLRERLREHGVQEDSDD
ncbi:MAG: lyase family protein [Spirochaetota bacterium]